MAEAEVSMGRAVLQACPPLGVAKMQGFGWVFGLNHPAELYMKGLFPNEGVSAARGERAPSPPGKRSPPPPSPGKGGGVGGDFSVSLHTSSWGRPWARLELRYNLSRY